MESLRRLQIENQIYQNNQAFFVRTEDHPDTNWIFCAIRIQHVMSGYVAVGLPDRAEASEHELRLTTALSDICSVEMQKHDFFIQRTGLQYETFFNELIEGRFSNLKMVESRFRVLNHHLGKFFCLAILYCTEPHNSELFNQRQMTALRKTYPNSMSVVYKNDIVPAAEPGSAGAAEPETDRAAGTVCPPQSSEGQLKPALRGHSEDSYFLRAGQKHPASVRYLLPEQLLFFSTEALPEYLFSKCDYKELETGIHYHIFQLQDYDREYHTELSPRCGLTCPMTEMHENGGIPPHPPEHLLLPHQKNRRPAGDLHHRQQTAVFI